MSQKRTTRSHSLNSRQVDETTPKGRKFSALSPEADNNLSKRPKSKARNMDAILLEINKKLELLPALEIKIDKIGADFLEMKQDVYAMKKRLCEVEKIQHAICEKVEKHELEMNVAQQLNLENQIMLTDIPKEMAKEKFITEVNNWTKNLFNELGHKKLILVKNANSTLVFIHFWNVKDKYRFMDFVKMHEKDKNGKYKPITNEMVFKLNDDDISNPRIINFRTPMTAINKEIFNQARRLKKQKGNIERIWMTNGSIFIKMKGQIRHTRLDTLKQLEDISNSLNMEMH